MVVNDKKNLPKSIIQFFLKDCKFLLTTKFLDDMTKPGMHNGIKKDNYYIINVDALLRLPHNVPVIEYRKFGKLLESCDKFGHSYLMIII